MLSRQWKIIPTGLKLRRKVFRMSNEWNDRILESLYDQAYDELIANGMDEKEAAEYAANLAIIRFEEEM